MVNQNYVLLGDIRIDGKPYRLVREQGTTLAVARRPVNEPPYISGAPDMLTEPIKTFHLGGFKSQKLVAGATEYGENTDGTNFRRLLPAPAVTQITLTNSNTPPTSIFECLGRIWVVCGRRVFRINPADDTMVESKDLGGGGELFVMGTKWEEDYGLFTTDQSTESLWKVTALGSPDTWVQSGDTVYSVLPTNSATGILQWTPSAGTNWETIDDNTAGNPVGAHDDDTTYNESVNAGTGAIVSELDQIRLDFTAISDVESVTLVTGRFRWKCQAWTLTGVFFDVLRITLQDTLSGAQAQIGVATVSGTTAYANIEYSSAVDPITLAPWDILKLKTYIIVIDHLTAATGGSSTFRVTQAYLQVQTVGAAAYRLAPGINRLFRITKTGELSNVSTGLDPMQEGNYADSIQIGEKDTLPTSLVAYERTVLAGKPEGVFAVGSEGGSGVPLIRRIARGTNNFWGMMNWEPWVMMPHARGLLRWLPGEAQSVGLEVEIGNRSPVRGQFRALAPDGQWLWGFIPVGSDTYILKGRDVRGEEPSFGPMIWDTVAKVAGNTIAAFVSATTTPPRLWFGLGNNIGYIRLCDVDDSNYRFATSGGGTRYFSKLDYGDPHSKDHNRIQVLARNMSATKTWTLAYNIDEAGWNNLTTITANGLQQIALPASAVGREVQYRATWANDSNTTPPELTFLESYAVPQPKKTNVDSILLQLEEGLRYENSARENRTLLEMLSALTTLSESASSVAISHPAIGTDIPYWITSVNIVRTFQQDLETPIFVVKLDLKQREGIQ